jgi:hypothetical protein
VAVVQSENRADDHGRERDGDQLVRERQRDARTQSSYVNPARVSVRCPPKIDLRDGFGPPEDGYDQLVEASMGAELVGDLERSPVRSLEQVTIPKRSPRLH